MDEEKLQPATTITTAEYNKLKEKADAFDFLFSKDSIKSANVMKLWMWRNKLEAIRTFVEECWLEASVPRWVLERLDSILGTRYGKILEGEE